MHPPRPPGPPLWGPCSLCCPCVRTAHVPAMQHLSPGCCLFLWASHSCPFRFLYTPLFHFVFRYQPLSFSPTFFIPLPSPRFCTSTSYWFSACWICRGRVTRHCNVSSQGTVDPDWNWVWKPKERNNLVWQKSQILLSFRLECTADIIEPQSDCH